MNNVRDCRGSPKGLLSARFVEGKTLIVVSSGFTASFRRFRLEQTDNVARLARNPEKPDRRARRERPKIPLDKL